MIPFLTIKYTFAQNIPCKIYDQSLIALMCYKLFTFLRFLNPQTGWHRFKKKKLFNRFLLHEEQQKHSMPSVLGRVLVSRVPSFTLSSFRVP